MRYFLTAILFAYVMSFPRARVFIDKINELVGYIAPYYLEQDKKQLIIAVGCTGGMHRSVVVASELYRLFKEQGLRVMIEQRDIKRDLQQRGYGIKSMQDLCPFWSELNFKNQWNRKVECIQF